MNKKTKTEKICPCGRIITDTNNKSGLCPKCQKMVGCGVALGGAIGIGVAIKKFVPKLVRGIIKVVK